MVYFHQTLVQVLILNIRQTITKMATAYQFASVCCCGHPILVIFNRISSKFIYGLLLSYPGSSLNMGFVRQTITKTADKMAATYQYTSVRCCGHSNIVILC